MRKQIPYLVVAVFAMFLAFSQAGGTVAGENDAKRITEPFTLSVLAEGLDFPWEMIWGPDGNLWVSERHGQRITRVNPETGFRRALVTIPEAYPGPQHEGILGMAFAPNFLKSRGGNYLYVYYTNKNPNSDARWGTLARFTYDSNREILSDKTVILDKLPAGDDHNAGRLRFGPCGNLFLTIGEQGHNQGGNACLLIEAQRLPTRDELDKKDWDSYRGKILRIAPDGGIPEDNPEIGGVKSHIYTRGHRNPQGLCFVGSDIYSVEHGPSSDDEINKIVAGGNYGWPHVAGYRDGMGYVYANYSAAPNCPSLPFDANVIPDGVPVQHELEWYDPDFQPPVKTFYTVADGHNFTDSTCSDMPYLCWPTIAPSDVIYYPTDGAIPSWRGSLLITTLKTGALFRVRMSGDQKQVAGDYETLFHSVNRYRAIAIDPEGKRVFIACDNSGGLKNYDGTPAGSVENPGSILVFTYKP